MKVIHQKDLYKNQKYQPSVHVGLKNLQINGALLAKCGLFRYPVK